MRNASGLYAAPVVSVAAYPAGRAAAEVRPVTATEPNNSDARAQQFFHEK